jgi:MoxR-like ATPase
MIQGVPILIDEVNRGSPDIQNSLLQAIDENEIVLREIGRIKATPGFFCLFTINEQDVGTTEIGKAFLRRIIYIGFAEPEDYTKWVRKEYPNISDSLLKQIEAIRLELKKLSTISSEIPPSSISAWARELISIYGPSVVLDRKKIMTTLGTILKNKTDIEEVAKAIDSIIKDANKNPNISSIQIAT